MGKEITGKQYIEAEDRYWWICAFMPSELRQQMPTLARFLSPSNYSVIPSVIDYCDSIQLSITGEQRYEMLLSPHAKALLTAFAARRLPTS